MADKQKEVERVEKILFDLWLKYQEFPPSGELAEHLVDNGIRSAEGFQIMTYDGAIGKTRFAIEPKEYEDGR